MVTDEKDLLDKIVEEVKNEAKVKADATEKAADKKEGDVKEKATDKSSAPATTPQKEAATTPAKPQQKSAPAAEMPKVHTTGASMTELFEKDETHIPQLGEPITGNVIDISGNVVLVDLGGVGTGMVIGREAKSGLSEDAKLAVGSTIEAVVTDMINEEGYIELSIREASYEKAWDDLRAKKDDELTVKTKILDANKGGLIVEMNGITGFLPVSQLSSKNYPRVEDGDRNKILELLKQLLGKELPVRILDVDQETEKLIVSEKAAHSEEERQAISGLSVGDIVEGEVSGVVDFGAFVKFAPSGSEEDADKNLEGLVHISELAWQLISDPREIIKVGEKVQAKIIGIDDTRISLSVKALLADPWTVIGEKYVVGKEYTGTVDKINPFGAFVYLDKDIHGLAHVSEFQEAFPGKKLDETIKAGSSYKWKVLSIEPKGHRMGLLLVDGKEVPKEEA